MKVRLHRPLVVSIACVTGLVLVVGLLIGGSLARLSFYKQKVAVLEREIEAKTSSLGLQSLTSEHVPSLQAMEAAVLEWRAMVESDSDRIAELSAVARDAGVTLVSLQSKRGAQAENARSLSRTHQLSGIGTYRQLARFLDGIYEARGMASIDKLEIETEEEGGARGLLRSSMEVTWHAPNPEPEATPEVTVEAPQ